MPKISIVLPTFNRGSFLKQSIDAIKAQTFEDWELIIVDDGSTDNTTQILESFLLEVTNPVQVIKQENQGPAQARNTGIKKAKGEFIAFYDSDDLWLSDHLESGITILSKFNDIDWLYASCKRVDFISGEVFEENSFYNGTTPKSLFSLNAEVHGTLHIIKDSKAAETSITHGIDSCFQASMIRNTVFNTIELPNFRVGEDRLFITMALKAGYTLAFNDKVNVIYNVHDDNISDTNPNADIEKRVQANERLVDSYTLTFDYINNFTPAEKKALNQKISDEVFWTIGYALLWENGFKRKAFNAYFRALKITPFNFLYWKTIASSFIKILIKA